MGSRCTQFDQNDIPRRLASMVCRFVMAVLALGSALGQVPGAHFVGSESCRGCHAKEYSGWKQTRMANVVRDPREHPDAVYMTGGTPEASPGWIYVYQQKDSDHYDLISKVKTRPGSGTSLFVPQLNRFYVASQALGDQEAAILVFEPVP